MIDRPSSPLGVCIWPEPGPNCARTVVYPTVVREILGHLGVPYDEVSPSDLDDRLPRLRILLTVGDADPDSAAREALDRWVRAGGALISIGGVCGMAELFGVEVELPSFISWGGGVGMLGPGYMRPSAPHAAIDHIRIPLRFFNGLPVRATGKCRMLAEALSACQTSRGRAALTEADAGEGCALLIAPDLPGAVVRIRQGIGITRDGVPAPDGTAPINDNVLKSDDGAVLDWDLDRVDVPGVPGYRAFLEPIADIWMELLARCILYAARRQRVALPLLWLYPRHLPALGVLSHDSDGNDPAKAQTLLREVASAGVRSTWCILAPGYPPETIEAIRVAGHELAMHYDAMSEDRAWSEAEFDSQHRALIGILGRRPASNKNHYLRWEGDTEFFDWCASRGVRLDQSKGASKTGEAGFNFGTCHPYRPVSPDGSVLDVLELPTPTQDLVVFAPPVLATPLTDAVLRSHGVLHLLFHPAHIETAGVAEALQCALAGARSRGVEWWTAEHLAEWETARRAARWSDYETSSAGACVRLSVAQALSDASVLWPVDGTADSCVARWGFQFRPVTLSAEAGDVVRLEENDG